MNTGRFLSIPAEEYHAASRRGRYMSSLLAAIRESPELYRRKTSGEIVSSKDYGFIVKLQKSVWMHTTASALLDDGIPKATVRVEYSGVPGQMRMDWFSGEYGIVAPPRPATASSGSRATASASGISSRWRSTTPCCKKPRARAWQSVSSPWRRTSRSARGGGTFGRSAGPGREGQRGRSRPLPQMPPDRRMADRLLGNRGHHQPIGGKKHVNVREHHAGQREQASSSYLRYTGAGRGGQGHRRHQVPAGQYPERCSEKPGGTQGRAARVQDRGAGLRRLA